MYVWLLDLLILQRIWFKKTFGKLIKRNKNISKKVDTEEEYIALC